MQYLKKILLIFGLVLILFIVSGLLLPVFIDVNDYKSKIEQLVEESINRKLTLQGDLELKTFPFLRVRTGALTLANPQGFPRQNMLEIQSAEIGIRLLPLVFKKVEAGTIKFDSPVVNLTKKSNGEVNWDFTTGKTRESDEKADDKSGAPLAAIAVQGFEISNAHVNYADLSSDTIVSVTDLNLKTGTIIPGTSFPFEITTNISGSMLAQSMLAELEGEINVDAALEKIDINQFSSVIVQQETQYEISSPEISLQLENKRLAINRLDLKYSADDQIQAEMITENLDVDLNSLAARLSNIKADFSSADIIGKLNSPSIEYDAETSSILLETSDLSVYSNEINADFTLPDTQFDITQNDISIENLTGKLSYQNLNTTLLFPEIRLSRDTMDLAANSVEMAIGESTVMADISGNVSTLAANFSLETENFNLKQILGALGTEVDTAKPTALTALSLDISGGFENNILSLRRMTGKLDATTFTGNAVIPVSDTPDYMLNLELGDLAIDDYLPRRTDDSSASGSETVTTAAGAPLALSQFNVSAVFAAKRIFSESSSIAFENLQVVVSPDSGKSSISFDSRVSGASVPEPLLLGINTNALINSAKNSMELSAFQMNLKGETIVAGLEIPTLEAPISAESIRIENIKTNFSNQFVNSELNIPDLNYSTKNSSLLIKNVSGRGNINEIQANIILPNLSVALDTQRLQINELALDLSGSKPLGRLSIPTLDVNLADKSFGPTNVIFEGQDGRAQINLKPATESDSYAGNLLASDFNLRGILDRLNILSDLSDKSALTRINIQSPVIFSQSRFRLDNIKASIDDTNISGYFDANLGLKPSYDFSIAIGELNADRYIPASSGSESTKSTKTVAAPVALPVGMFKDTFAKGDLRFELLRIGGAEFSDLDIGVTSDGSKLSISPIKSNFFDGRMNGNLAIDSAGNTPRLDFDYELSDVALEPALSALGITDKLAGNGNFRLRLNGSGKTDREMVASLTGNSNLDIKNGSLKGINIQDILFNAYQTYATLRNKTVNSKYNPADRTEFSSLTGSWIIKNGLISGDDLQIQAPLFRVNGVGVISLVDQSIDYLLDVKVVKSLEGQGGKMMNELEGRSIPLGIRGSLADPQYSLDVSSMVKNEVITKAEEEIQQKIEDKLGEKLEGEGSLNEKLQKKAVEKAGEKLLDLFKKF